MTAVIHHGPPGSFKSFSIVQRVMIDALKKGRVVVTNMRGFNDVNHIAETMGFDAPDTAKIYAVDADTEEGFQHIARFFQWAPAGALIVIDEAQRAYPTRLRSFSDYDQPDDVVLSDDEGNPFLDQDGQPIYRPPTVENAFDQHRHCNWDIYLSTPNITKIHKEIRGVCEWAYRHRDITGIHPFSKRQKWREFKHDPEFSGKSVSHYFGTPQTYRVDKRVFTCYQSTKTGKAKGSNENISILRDRKIQLAIFLVCGSALYLFSKVSEVYDQFSGNDQSIIAQTADLPSSLPVSDPEHVASDARAVVHRSPSHTLGHALTGFTLRYVGSINDQLLFHVYLDDREYIVFNDQDLAETGFQVEIVTDGFVRLVHDTGLHEIYAFAEPVSRPGRDSSERSYASDAVAGSGRIL